MRLNKASRPRHRSRLQVRCKRDYAARPGRDCNAVRAMPPATPARQKPPYITDGYRCNAEDSSFVPFAAISPSTNTRAPALLSCSPLPTDSVGAATSASEYVISALNCDVGPQYGVEDRQF